MKFWNPLRDRCLAPFRGRAVLAPAILTAMLALVPGRAQAVITITEIMYNPAGGARNLEYIELHNETPDPMDLTGYFFRAGIDFTFTERTFLDPGAYIVVCADKEAIRAKYGIENVVGDWSPDTSLNNGGEAVELANPGGLVESRVEYNDRGKWPSGADGTGHSLELEYVYTNTDDPDRWSLSGVLGGSPGKPNDTAAGAVPVVVNEAVLIGAERWVEIYNRGTEAVNLTGYHLTDDRANLSRGTLPAVVIEPRAFLTFTETGLGLNLAQDAEGRTFIALVSPGGARVIDARSFEPEPGVSEARIPDGDAEFSSFADPTPGAANKLTVIRDVVINEIFYHPPDKDSRGEFIEIYNRGTAPVSLTGWRFDKGVNFDFPAGTTIAPDSYIVVARDPAHVRDVYKLPAAVVLGPRDEDALERFGVLRDAGERVTLLDERGNIASTVRYFDGGEWPQWADGGGSSMELIDAFQDNGEAQTWDSSDESPKSPVKEYAYDGTFSGGEGEFHLVLTSKGITMVDDLKMSSQVTTVEPLITYFDFGTTWRYAKGLTEASDPPDLWQKPEFDDSGWTEGAAILGYGDGDEATTLADMMSTYSTFYVRKAFDVPDPSAIESLVLEVEYDDGYIAFLNGVEVASDNIRPGAEGRTFDALARLAKEKAKALVDLTEKKNLVVQGRNVLAVHVLNNTVRSNDVRWKAQLLSGRFVITEGPNLFKDGSFESEGYKSSWTIQGTHVRSARTTQSPLSGEGSLKIISTGGGDNKVNRIETSNTGLTAPVARVDYHISFLAKWIAGTPTLLTHGAYSGTLSPSYATSHRLELPPNPGTPGAVNSVTLLRVAATGSRNIGPVISGVRQTPALPAALQDVEVRARVRDSDGVGSVSLFWTLDTPKPAGDAALTEVILQDPDKDGVYTGVIPGQAAKKRVVFHIVARDTLGKEGRFPLDVLGRTNPIFNDPAAASVNDALYSIYRHDTPFNGKPHSYRFWMHQANESYMSSRPLHSNDVVDGSFVFQNRDIYYNSKVRFSGSPWARGGWGESYRVQMPKDRPLHESIENFGMEDHQNGGARVGNERISHYLIRYNQGHTVVPYSLQWLVQFQVNDRVNEVREHVQVPNGDFLQRWFPDDDDGSFFEMDDRHTINDAGQRAESLDGRLLYPPYGPSTLGEDKEQYRYYFSTRGPSKEGDDFSHLVSLAKLLTQSVTNNTDFDAVIWDHVDVEQWLRQWAIRLNSDDWDCWGARRGKNCYLYRPNGTGLWNIFPWDMELTYGDVGAFMPPVLTAASNPTYGNTFAECARFINRPPIKRMYYGILKEMVDNQFQSSFLIPYMQKLDSIQVQNTGIGKTNGYIDQRRTRLLGVLRGVTSPTIEFQVTTNGGNPLEVDSPSVSIEGRAPVDISNIVVMVNGRQLEPPFTVAFSQTDVLGWTAEGNLPLGKNTLGFVGLNGLDEIVGSVTFEVTYTSPVPPVIDGVTPSSMIAGELIAITGRNFKDGLKVLFGAVEAVDIALDPADRTRLAAVVPAGLPLGDVALTIQNPNGMTSVPVMVRIVAEKKRFLRGDIDQSGVINLADIAQVLRYLFQGESEPRCLDAADVDDNGLVNLTDALFAARFLFQGGAPPPAPHPELGADPTEDSIDCAFGQE